MKDKNGKEIKIGDVVKHSGSTGTVVEVTNDYYICNNWADGYGNGGRMQMSSYVEIIKSAEQETFTEQDEELLQKLTNKKSQALKSRINAIKAFDDLREALYTHADCIHLQEYITANIDKICDTLQNYKKHYVK